MFKSVFHSDSADLLKDCNDTFEAFRNEAKMNCESCVWSSLLCIMALATVVNCPIQSIYTPKSNTKIANLFTRKFKSCVESNKIGLKLPPSEKTLKRPRKQSKISFYQNHGMQNLQIEVNTCSSKVIIDSENKMISKSADEGNTTAAKKTKTVSTPIVIQMVNNSPDTKILQPETFPKDAIAESKPDTKMPETAITSANLIKSTKGTKTGINVTNTGRNIKECNRVCFTGNIVLRGLPVKSRDECDPNDIGTGYILTLLVLLKLTLKSTNYLKTHGNHHLGIFIPITLNRADSGESIVLCQTSKYYYSWLCYSAYLTAYFVCLVLSSLINMAKVIWKKSLKNLSLDGMERHHDGQNIMTLKSIDTPQVLCKPSSDKWKATENELTRLLPRPCVKELRKIVER